MSETIAMNKMFSARPLYKRTSRRKMGRRNALRALERIIREIETIMSNCDRLNDNANLHCAAYSIRYEVDAVDREMQTS